MSSGRWPVTLPRSLPVAGVACVAGLPPVIMQEALRALRPTQPTVEELCDSTLAILDPEFWA